MNPPLKLRQAREKVPCFGNDPKTDIELLRRINNANANHSDNARCIKLISALMAVVFIIVLIVAL